MTISSIINGLLVLIPLGGSLRIAILAVSLISNQDEEKAIKGKIFNTIKFVVIASCVGIIKDLVLRYYN
ncbi:hypothetical protein [Ruminococcus sp. Marseille-P6503]|uniref:hypothetical protein n=1 Tax=Ruminococcus sp. Marseille-P6503 TaxID=2364796 RepID=UPI000F547E9D|nr:hypothetical protein [Ruminococcus sp. Marseille-P6503]